MVRHGRGRVRRGDEGDLELGRWVDAARAGDTAAFGWIWQRLSPRVHGYVRGRGVASPEDVTSEVFLAAFTSLGRFDGGGAEFRPWLFTIAHHKAADDLRRRVPVAEYDADTDPRTAASAESAALDGIVDADVRAMLDALTPEQREVLLLRSLADLSLEQVAEVTGRTVGAVKQLHHRAVASARRASAAAPVSGPSLASVLPLPRSSGADSPGTPVTRAASNATTEL